MKIKIQIFGGQRWDNEWIEGQLVIVQSKGHREPS